MRRRDLRGLLDKLDATYPAVAPPETDEAWWLTTGLPTLHPDVLVAVSRGLLGAIREERRRKSITQYLGVNAEAFQAPASSGYYKPERVEAHIRRLVVGVHRSRETVKCNSVTLLRQLAIIEDTTVKAPKRDPGGLIGFLVERAAAVHSSIVGQCPCSNPRHRRMLTKGEIKAVVEERTRAFPLATEILAKLHRTAPKTMHKAVTAAYTFYKGFLATDAAS